MKEIMRKVQEGAQVQHCLDLLKRAISELPEENREQARRDATAEILKESTKKLRITDEERNVLKAVVKKLKGSSEKVRRAQVLLAADADGPNWTDKRIAEAYTCRTKTVENIRQRLVSEGFDIAIGCGRRGAKSRSAKAVVLKRIREPSN